MLESSTGKYIYLGNPFALKAGSYVLLLVAFLFPLRNFSQTSSSSVKVSGVVIDEAGMPLANTSIADKNAPAHITASGADGRFSIELNRPSTLVFSHIGFQVTYVVIKASENNLRVQLRQHDSQLQDVVVIGYGTSTREKLTGSVAKVSAKDIGLQPVGNPLAALQGRMAGVVVNSGTGVPGSNISIQIRGTNTVAAGSNPLYLIDGVPVPYEPFARLGGAEGFVSDRGGQSPLNGINPADIESIEVLKDADATAIYGSRGSNGVVLITTRKGKAGRTKFDVDIYSGASKVTNTLDVLSTSEYIALRKAAFAADGIPAPTAAMAPDLITWSQTQQTDWQKELMGNRATVTNAQMNISGGNENTRFMLGASYRNEGDVLIGDSHNKRGNTHLNLQHTSTNRKFNLNGSITYANDQLTSNGTNPYSYLMQAPNLAMYDSTGKKPFWYSTALNPSALKFVELKTQKDYFIGNATLRYQVLEGLEAKVDLGYTRQNMRQVQKFFSSYTNPFGSATYANEAMFGNAQLSTYSVEPQLNYSRKVSDGTLSVLLGSTFQESTNTSDYIYARGFPSDELLGSLASAATIAEKASKFTQYRYHSVFGRVGYDWQGKYIVNGTLRRDASSRFGEGKRFGSFWAVGGAWLFSKEDFVQAAVPFISYGKLRGSYGLTGNDQITDYEYMPTYAYTTYPYMGVAGLFPARLANPDYSWEKNNKLEFAAELGFLNNSILFNAAWFQNRASNQLVKYPLPSQSGYASYQANLPALIENKGWEFELTTRNISSRNFTWTTSFNFTTFRNKLLKFPGLASSSYSNKYEIGQSINVIRSYRFLGINPDNGLAILFDKNGDKSYVAADDKVSVGDTDPRFYGGLSNHFAYKGIELDVFFQFQQKTDYGYLYYNFRPPGTMMNVSKEYAKDYWTTPGQAAKHPRLTAIPGGPVYANYFTYYTDSDAALSDASFIRLKNVSLSYSLPKSWMDRIKLDNVKVYVQGQNLLTFTSYDGLDPETPFLTPPLKTVVAGIRVSL